MGYIKHIFSTLNKQNFFQLVTYIFFNSNILSNNKTVLSKKLTFTSSSQCILWSFITSENTWGKKPTSRPSTQSGSPLSTPYTRQTRTRPPVHLCRASTSREELALFNTADCVLPAFRVAKHKLGVPCLLKNSRVGLRLGKGFLN